MLTYDVLITLVYVIHVHPKVFWSEEIIALFRPWDGRNVIWVLAAMVGAAAAVFVLCVLLDAVRQPLFRVHPGLHLRYRDGPGR